jgi:hypothetical protein
MQLLMRQARQPRGRTDCSALKGQESTVQRGQDTRVPSTRAERTGYSCTVYSCTRGRYTRVPEYGAESRMIVTDDDTHVVVTDDDTHVVSLVSSHPPVGQPKLRLALIALSVDVSRLHCVLP